MGVEVGVSHHMSAVHVTRRCLLSRVCDEVQIDLKSQTSQYKDNYGFVNRLFTKEGYPRG